MLYTAVALMLGLALAVLVPPRARVNYKCYMTLNTSGLPEVVWGGKQYKIPLKLGVHDGGVETCEDYTD